jgi:hypothetical protein
MPALVADDVGPFLGILTVVALGLWGTLSTWLVWSVIRSGRL